MSCNCGNNCSGCDKTIITKQGQRGAVGPQGIPGTNGVDGLDGATGPQGPAGVADVYQAWADDALGTGYTTTPSDKCFYATTGTIAGASPVAGDFTGLYFRINQPVTRYNTASLITDTEALTAPGGTIAFSPLPSALVLPAAFLNSVNSYAEFVVDFKFLAASPGANIDIQGALNANNIALGSLPTSGTTRMESITKVFRLDSSNVKVIMVANIYHLTASPLQVEINEYTLAISDVTDIEFNIKDYYHDVAEGTLSVNFMKLDAFNPDKTTC